MMAAGVCLFLSFPNPALAQDGKWEVEVHGGGAVVSNVSGGTGTVPGPGAPFATVTRAPSRLVSSWYFGDGSNLLNAALPRFGLTQRITPLDPVLTRELAERGHGASFGVRLARDFTPRFGAEFNVDYAAAPVDLTSGALADIEASVDSFVPAFQALLSTGPFANVATTSAYVTEHGAGNQVTATGALTINLLTEGRLVPYATVGAGVLANQGDMPTVNVDGSYSFNIVGIFPVSESDSVRIRYVVDDTVFVGVVGGGVKVYLTSQSGLRFDVRAHLGTQTVQTLVSADPGSVRTNDALLSAWIASFTVPSIQFSNSSQQPTTLGGPSIRDFESFKTDGAFRQVMATAGYFWRF